MIIHSIYQLKNELDELTNDIEKVKDIAFYKQFASVNYPVVCGWHATLVSSIEFINSVANNK